jgi:replicative DNA helicase
MSQRVPPYSAGTEKAIVGLLLVRPDALDEALGAGLSAADFYTPKWGTAFATVCELSLSGDAVDALTVSEAIKAKGLDAPTTADLLEAVGDRVMSLDHGRAYAERVHGLAQLRRVQAAGAEISEAAYGTDAREDVPAFLDKAEQTLMSATERRSGPQGAVPLGQVLDEALVELRARASGEHRGLQTGFADLDRMTGGLRPGQLVILAARPSIGKSALALDIGLNVAQRGQPVLVFSLEMSRQEWAERALAHGGVSSERINSGRLDALSFETLEGFRQRIGAAPLMLDDDGAATLLAIRAKARRMAAKGGLALLVVDYLQLVAAEHKERRELAVASVSRGLKQLAGELHLPVLAVAQVNRAVEQRADKRPTLADLRESGSLEQDADLVLVLHREAAYDLEADLGAAELIVRKHRNGPTGLVPLVWLPGRMSFANALKEPAF